MDRGLLLSAIAYFSTKSGLYAVLYVSVKRVSLVVINKLLKNIVLNCIRGCVGNKAVAAVTKEVGAAVDSVV